MENNNYQFYVLIDIQTICTLNGISYPIEVAWNVINISNGKEVCKEHYCLCFEDEYGKRNHTMIQWNYTSRNHIHGFHFCYFSGYDKTKPIHWTFKKAIDKLLKDGEGKDFLLISKNSNVENMIMLKRYGYGHIYVQKISEICSNIDFNDLKRKKIHLGIKNFCQEHINVYGHFENELNKWDDTFPRCAHQFVCLLADYIIKDRLNDLKYNSIHLRNTKKMEDIQKMNVLFYYCNKEEKNIQINNDIKKESIKKKIIMIVKISNHYYYSRYFLTL